MCNPIQTKGELDTAIAQFNNLDWGILLKDGYALLIELGIVECETNNESNGVNTTEDLQIIRKQINKDRECRFYNWNEKDQKISSFIADPLDIGYAIFKVRKEEKDKYNYVLKYAWNRHKRIKAHRARQMESGDKTDYNLDEIDLRYHLTFSPHRMSDLNRVSSYLYKNSFYDLAALTDEHKDELKKALGVTKDSTLEAIIFDYIHLRGVVYSDQSLAIDVDDHRTIDGSFIHPNAVTEFDEVIDETDSFGEKMHRLRTAFLGAVPNRTTTASIRSVITRFLVYSLTSESSYFDDKFERTRRVLIETTASGTDKIAILEKPQKLGNEEQIIEIDEDKLRACCDTSAIFDTLVACWLIANNSICVTNDGKANFAEFHGLIKEAYDVAVRGNPPSKDALRRNTTSIHVKAMVEAFLDTDLSITL